MKAGSFSGTVTVKLHESISIRRRVKCERLLAVQPIKPRQDHATSFLHSNYSM